ncbi:MAG: CDP-glycerol glycerophosphotransferase family protein [Liquorilactobacillus ghanensis]|uniref:CDP-glycerol glycerophosphotransferase family protein n=1 Tax=Liquorilactobacillus ghanensis TaxID=399370 RepID=UPI0039E72E58
MFNFKKNFFYKISGFSLRSNNIFVFGAWFGERFGDNPKYLLMEMLNSNAFKNKKFIWVGNDSLAKKINDRRITFVQRNSFKSIFYQLRAKNFFFTHGYQDFGDYSFLKGAKCFQLWHGFPIKRIGADSPITPNEGKKIYEKYQYFLANSTVMAERMKTAFSRYGAQNENILIASTPRVDYLRENSNNFSLKSVIKNKLGIDSRKFVITYLPTFRDRSNEIFSFQKSNNKEFDRMLKKKNAILLERQHFVKRRLNIGNRTGNYFDLDETIDTQDILLITDLLISDYSSVYVDFITLDKPIIHFLYDGNNYLKKDRGIYASEPRTEFAGPIAYTMSDLISLINERKGTFEKYRKNAIKNLKFDYNSNLRFIDLYKNSLNN